jgi:threonyl-tRNA synthetase
VRARADNNAERMNAKIRSAQLMKIPYMLVVGDQEAAAGTVSLRKRDGSRQDNLPLDQFMALVTDRIATRAGEL